MTKKQLAVALGAAMTAIAGILSQCPDDPAPAPRTGVTTVDAGAR